MALPLTCAAFATLGANNFVGNQSVTGNLSLSGSLTLPATTNASIGVINLGGARFAHGFGSNNTFVGQNAGNFSMGGGLIDGTGNTATGVDALSSNMTGSYNTAIGGGALQNNTTGSSNTASGTGALVSNTTGFRNTAYGDSALRSNTSGAYNTAIGLGALSNNTSGDSNIAIGIGAGSDSTTGSNNIYIANLGAAEGATIRIGTSGRQTKTFIAGIASVGVTSAAPVMVDANGQLGVTLSSRRFKYDIHDMDEASTDLLRLRPVTFRYKQAQGDGSHPMQYGLIAEEVAEVNPGLVQYAATGEVNTVLYQMLPPMLLNEAQKQRRQIETQARQMVAQERQIQAQQEETKRASLQKDVQIRKLTQQVQELQRSQQVIATLEARLARMEAAAQRFTRTHTKKARRPRTPRVATTYQGSSPKLAALRELH